MNYYRIHDSVIRCNRHLSWPSPVPRSATSLPSTFPSATPTVNIELGTLAWLRERYPGLPWPQIEPLAAGTPADPNQAAQLLPHILPVDEALLMFSRGNNHLFVARLSKSGDSIHIGWSGTPDMSETDLETAVATYWLPSLLGLALRLRGRLVLHANAISIDGRAAIWLGTKGAGKSTLTAAFVAAGFPILADDQVVLQPQSTPGQATSTPPAPLCVWPGIAHIRLWAESLAGLETGDPTLHIDYPLGPGIKGLLNGHSAVPGAPEPKPQPVVAVYMLEPRDPALTAPRFTPLSSGEGLHRLLQNRLAAKSLSVPPAQTQAEFIKLAALCRQAPVYTLQLPDALERLPPAVLQIAAHVRTAASTVSCRAGESSHDA